MKSLRYFVLFLLPLSVPAQAEDSAEALSSPREGPWNSGFVSSLNVGFRYSSTLTKRGATMYDNFQLDPVLGVFLFDDRFEFLGDSVGYRDFVFEKMIRARLRLVAISDDPLFPKKASRLGPSNSRQNTYELNSSLEFFLPQYDGTYAAELDLNFSQDIATHHGQYLELVSKTRLFSYREPWAGTLLEPNAVVSLGYGSKAHNRYLYGDNLQKGGVSYVAAGLQLALPETADRFYPIVLLQYYSTVGSARRGSLVSGKTSGVLLQFIATAGLLD